MQIAMCSSAYLPIIMPNIYIDSIFILMLSVHNNNMTESIFGECNTLKFISFYIILIKSNNEITTRVIRRILQ